MLRRDIRSTLVASIVIACCSPAFGDPSPSQAGSQGSASAGPAWTIQSPDGRLGVSAKLIQSNGQKSLRYAIDRDGRRVIGDSAIRFVLASGEVVGDSLEVVAPATRSVHRGEWSTVYGERSEVQAPAEVLELVLKDSDSGLRLEVNFRCYNGGVAFRSRLVSDDPEEQIKVAREACEFHLRGDAVCWATTNAQGLYERRRLDRAPENMERPLASRLAEGLYVAIAEAAQVDYPRMLLSPDGEKRDRLVTDLSGTAKSTGEMTTPWRVVLVGSRPGELIENNGIILDLNEPCQIADTSWIRPGKVLREITLTNEGAEASIDFAAENGFQFVEFDAGWYGHEYDDASDATTVTVDPKRSPGPLDLPWLIERAKRRGVGVILYVNRRALEKQLDEILPLYRRWGVAGVKYGFVQVGPQQATTWLLDAVRQAAEHRLMVDVHDDYRPTGFSRTYPNLMTQEGVRGDEASPSAEQTLTSLFTRGIAGGTDFTVCFFSDRVDELWTHGHQLAKPICFYSPWQFLYWYDTPLEGGGHEKKATIVDTPDQELFRRLPTTWDETRVLQGEIGQYAVVARRSGDDWFLGVLNGADPRELSVSLEFLDPDARYEVLSFSDDASVETPTEVRVDSARLSARETLAIPLLANGGFSAHFTPVPESKGIASSAVETPR